MTALACLERSAVLGSCAVAMLTLHETRNLQFLCHTCGQFAQSKFYLYAEVATLRLTATTRRAARCRAETTESAIASAAEYIAEMSENILHRHSAGVETTSPATKSGRTHGRPPLVVFGSLVGI